ncbi:MAG TPA: sigma-70 family RNA polymerase sigma factor [Gaiellaceae bacterium]|nr:sigma-70 family RNA polymerase sigma factor [Gaiellaceae bacterium]
MSLEERQLLDRAKDGDLEAFAEFVRHFERRVRTVLFRILDDARDVEEATQDTFVQAWRHLDRFRGDAAPFTWLYRIATNEALQRRRRVRVETVEFSDEHAPELDPELEAGELRTVLAEEIRALPFEYRTALVLRDVEGFSNDEVAQALEITVAAAKSRIHRARMTLRERLEQVDELPTE